MSTSMESGKAAKYLDNIVRIDQSLYVFLDSHKADHRNEKKVATHGLSVQFGTFPPKEDRVFPKGVSQGHVTAFDCSIKAKHVLFICVHI